MSKETFASRLETIRKAAGMSQYKLAKESGVSAQALSELERGLNQPSWATVQAIARALGTDCTAFQLQEEPKPAAKRKKEKE